jgi:hypothetical protein
MKMRAVVIGVMLALSIFLYSGYGFESHNTRTLMVIIGFFGFIEAVLYILPNKGTVRLTALWLVALAAPPFWSWYGMVLLFAGLKPMASQDVALPWVWMICTIVLYVHAVAISVVETIQSRY